MTSSRDSKTPGSDATTPAPPERRTGPRANVVVPVLCRYESVLDFVETQSMNISHTGMFIATDTPAPLGSTIAFDFMLADGFSLLKGSAEVVRVVTEGTVNGMGVKFIDLDEPYVRLIKRIVAVNDEEGRDSTLNLDFSRPATAGSRPIVDTASPAPSAASERPIFFEGRNLRLVLGPLTVHHFTQNPLLNVRSGGFFIPADEQLPLGTVFQVEIVDATGRVVIAAKGKIVAKQDLRVGIRLVDADKDAIARLRAEVAKLAPAK